jgi:hypothetical protein
MKEEDWVSSKCSLRNIDRPHEGLDLGIGRLSLAARGEQLAPLSSTGSDMGLDPTRIDQTTSTIKTRLRS